MDDGPQAVAARVCQVELGGEELALGVEHFQVAGGAALEPVEGDGGNAFLRGDQLGSLGDDLASFLVGVQRVGGFLEGQLGGDTWNGLILTTKNRL